MQDWYPACEQGEAPQEHCEEEEEEPSRAETWAPKIERRIQQTTWQLLTEHPQHCWSLTTTDDNNQALERAKKQKERWLDKLAKEMSSTGSRMALDFKNS